MWNTGNTEWADTLLAPTWRDHSHPEITQVEYFKAVLVKTRSAFPDFHITITTLLSQDDLVALRAVIHTNKPSSIMWFVRVVDGIMQEMWTGSEIIVMPGNEPPL